MSTVALYKQITRSEWVVVMGLSRWWQFAKSRPILVNSVHYQRTPVVSNLIFPANAWPIVNFRTANNLRAQNIHSIHQMQTTTFWYNEIKNRQRTVASQLMNLKQMFISRQPIDFCGFVKTDRKIHFAFQLNYENTSLAGCLLDNISHKNAVNGFSIVGKRSAKKAKAKANKTINKLCFVCLVHTKYG